MIGQGGQERTRQLVDILRRPPPQRMAPFQTFAPTEGQQQRADDMRMTPAAPSQPVSSGPSPYTQAAKQLGELLQRAGDRREQATGAAEGQQSPFERGVAMLRGAMAGQQAPAAPQGQGSPQGFAGIASRLTGDLMRDFNLSREQAGGIVGPLAQESAGFGTLQEISPLVPGSRGGWGYAQWTGPRRVAMENWARERNLDPSSYEANYGFLRHELANTNEGRVLNQVRGLSDPRAVAETFTNGFLRPGIPNMDSRMRWTDRVMAVPAPGAPNGVAAIERASPMGAASPAAMASFVPQATPTQAAPAPQGQPSPLQAPAMSPEQAFAAIEGARPGAGQAQAPAMAQRAPDSVAGDGATNAPMMAAPIPEPRPNIPQYDERTLAMLSRDASTMAPGDVLAMQAALQSRPQQIDFSQFFPVNALQSGFARILGGS